MLDNLEGKSVVVTPKEQLEGQRSSFMNNYGHFSEKKHPIILGSLSYHHVGQDAKERIDQFFDRHPFSYYQVFDDLKANRYSGNLSLLDVQYRLMLSSALSAQRIVDLDAVFLALKKVYRNVDRNTFASAVVFFRQEISKLEGFS